MDTIMVSTIQIFGNKSLNQQNYVYLLAILESNISAAKIVFISSMLSKKNAKSQSIEKNKMLWFKFITELYKGIYQYTIVTRIPKQPAQFMDILDIIHMSL